MEEYMYEEYMYNIDDEQVVITGTENGAIVEYPDGHKKIFNSYDKATTFLYRHGWIF